MDFGEVGAHTVFLASLVWALVEYIVKPLVPSLDDTQKRGAAFAIAVVLGVVYLTLSQYASLLDQVGQFALYALTANVLHNVSRGNGTKPSA